MGGIGGMGGTGGVTGGRIVFVLPQAGTAMFLTNAGDFSAIDGACTTAANMAGHPGPYGALLADGSLGVNRFSFAINRPISLPDGTPVSAGLLFSGTLMHPINLLPNGGAVPGTNYCVWTGFNAGGTTTGSSCVNWSSGSNTMLGTVGDMRHSDAQWADAVDIICSQPCFIYCLEI